MRGQLARAVLIGVVAVASAFVPVAAHAASTVAPPQDSSARGFIGLCGPDNKNVSGGDINTTPFVWKAVASQSPPAAMVGRGQNTILNVYQPRAGVDPSQWSGDQLTGASFYTSAAAPAAQATLKDLSLATIVREFPPIYGGLYELRMYFGKANVSTYSQTYPATYIRVNGNKWSVVTGGQVNCAAAGAQSLEVLSGVLTQKQAYGSPLPSPTGRPTAVATSSSNIASGSADGSSQSPGGVAARASSKSSSSAVVWIVAVAAVLAAGAGGLWWRRRSTSS